MTRKTRASLTTLLVALLGVVIAVALVDGCTIVNGLVADPPDTGLDAIDGGDGGEGGEGGGCVHELLPREPTDRGTAGGAETIIVVVHDLSFGLGDGGALLPLGYDLDGVCSCNPDPESCTPRVGRKCDDTGNGRDNGGQVLIREALVAGLDVEAAGNDSFEQGEDAILIHVSGYNGEANDGEVRVAYVRSDGLFDDAGTNHVPPTKTTNDKWTVDDRAVFDKDGVITPIVTVPGFVTGFTLVAPAIRVELPLAGVTTLGLDPASLVAKIVPLPGGGHTISEGTVVGRWPVTEAIKVLGSFRPNESSPRFCENPLLFSQLKVRACEGADIRARPSDDNKGLGCDAISAALHVQASPASFGKLRTIQGRSFCDDAGVECPDAGK